MKNLKIVFALLSLFLCSAIFAQSTSKSKSTKNIYETKDTKEMSSKYGPHSKTPYPEEDRKLPDLVVTFIEYDHSNFVEGEAAPVVRYGVKNIGHDIAFSHLDAPDGVGYFIDVVISSDDTPPNGLADYDAQYVEDVLLRGGRVEGKTIRPGQQVVFVEDDLVLPTGFDCQWGPFIGRFGVNIDPNNTLEEMNDDNNWMSMTMPIECKEEKPEYDKLPDLVVNNIQFQQAFDSFIEGQPMGKIEVEIQNVGEGPAVLPYLVDLFLSTDADAPQGIPLAARNNLFLEDVLLSNGSQRPLVDANGNLNAGRMEGMVLQPNETVVLSTEGCVAPINLPNCYEGLAALQIGVYIDAGQRLPESNDENNTYFQTIMIECSPTDYPSSRSRGGRGR